MNTADSNAIFTTEGHYMALPHSLTNKTHSNSIRQTCPRFLPHHPLYSGPPLEPEWIERCQEFVGGDFESEVPSYVASSDLGAIDVMYESYTFLYLLNIAMLFLLLMSIFNHVSKFLQR